jgi:hypothetical protein
MTMYQPYQKIALIPRGNAIESSFLLVASGETLSNISLKEGFILSGWPDGTVSNGGQTEASKAEEVEHPARQ